VTYFMDGEEEKESKSVFMLRLTILLKKMMYVSGETAEPSPETTGMVEEIVRQQVIEMVRKVCRLELQRGSRARLQKALDVV
jgi:hypothetical protein